MLTAFDALLLWRRVERFDLVAPEVADGRETWLLLGSDDRSELGALAGDPAFHDAQGGGARADIVIVVQRWAGQVRSVALSRDLLIVRRSAAPLRLGLALTRGPQAVVDSLCEGLGIAVDHVAIIDMQGFSDLVDTLGGIEVEVPTPISDAATGLALDTPGRQRLDGPTALAWVRSRRPQLDVGATTRPDDDGDGGRVSRASSALAGVAEALPDPWRQPILTRRLAGSVAEHLSVSSSAGVGDLRALISALEEVGTTTRDLPVRRRDGEVPLATLAPEALVVLRALGADGEGHPCRVAVTTGDVG